MRTLIFLQKLLPILFWILLSFAFDLPHVAILTGIAAIIHELGHIGAILKLHGITAVMKGRLYGPKISVSGLGYRDELIILACGPGTNILSSALSLPFLFFETCSPYVIQFILINILTAATNLLPIRDFDGYKILYCLLSKRKNCLRMQDMLYWISFVLTSALALLALYFVLKLGEGYWGFVLFISIILSEIGKRSNRTI